MRQSAKALIRDGDGKILVLYRSATHPHLAHDIDLPGGEIDRGEMAVDGLVREIVEETTLVVELSNDDLVHSWQSSFFGEQQLLFETRVTGGGGGGN